MPAFIIVAMVIKTRGIFSLLVSGRNLKNVAFFPAI